MRNFHAEAFLLLIVLNDGFLLQNNFNLLNLYYGTNFHSVAWSEIIVNWTINNCPAISIHYQAKFNIFGQKSDNSIQDDFESQFRTDVFLLLRVISKGLNLSMTFGNTNNKWSMAMRNEFKLETEAMTSLLRLSSEPFLGI